MTLAGPLQTVGRPASPWALIASASMYLRSSRRDVHRTRPLNRYARGTRARLHLYPRVQTIVGVRDTGDRTRR